MCNLVTKQVHIITLDKQRETYKYGHVGAS